MNMETEASVHPRLSSRLGAVLAGALSAAILAGCGTASAPGRPHVNRPESSKAKTPGTPRPGTGAGGVRGGVPRPGTTHGGTGPSGRTTPRPGTGRHYVGTNVAGGRTDAGTNRTGTGFFGTASGLFGWGMGRPPGGVGSAFGRPAKGLPPTAGYRAGPKGTTGRATGFAKPATTRPGSGLKAGKGSAGTPRGGASRPSSPYGNAATRALADRLGGAHRGHSGTYAVPAGHVTGQPLSTASTLATLPAWSMLEHYNGYLVSYAHLTPWVASMGVHWGHRGPSLVVMQNRNHQVTAVETAFPAGAGWHSWYDQPQGKPAGTIYSEHLYFVPPGAITQTMPKNQPTDLTRWQAFARVNAPRLAAYGPVGPDPTARAMQYGPKGPAIRVLVDKASHVVGFVGAWSSNSPQGWRPWFDQRQGAPIQDPVLGSVYTQHLWLVDPRSLATS
jgi:hypothetical protein